jgi:hypothetical protein
MNNLGITFTILVILVSLVVHLRRRRADARMCSTRPNVRALQISCLAVQALGVQFFWREQPTLMPPTTFAVVCIVVGVAGLGYASIFCDCRDDELRVTNL